MKHLYYLEAAKSIDSNNQPIPAKSLKWVPRNPKIAYESMELCNQDRIDYQKSLFYHIIRVARAGWLKTILIRISARFGDDWVVFK